MALRLRPIALGGAGLAAVVALLVLGCGGGSSTGPVDLIFVSTRDGDYAIFGMSADGKHQRRLTAEHGNTSSLAAPYFQDEPAWSPDGRRIVFTSNRTGRFLLYVMRADGTGTRQLTSGPEDTHPTWSPDGKKIAFVRGPQEHLVTMNADGTGVHRVTDDAALEDDPAWSPNGQWIAYSRKAPGEEVRELWLVRPDGSRRHRLTSLNAVSTSPTWSPGSNRIAFESNVQTTTIELFVIGADGKGLQRLTVPVGVDDIDPAWSPHGEAIAFSRDGAIATISGGEEKELTSRQNNDSSPVWNPRVRRGFA